MPVADRRRYRRLAIAAGRMPPPAAPPATFGGRLPDARGPARSATTRGLARVPARPSRGRRLATAAARIPPPAAPPATFGGRLPDARGPARSATTRGLARLPTLPSLRQHTREGPRPGNKSNGVSAPRSEEGKRPK